MNTLQPEEWATLKDVSTLLHTFADLTNIAGGEKYPTLSLVIVYYYELERHLKKMLNIPSVKVVARIMLDELGIRFQQIFDYSDPSHESIYLVATMLDPRFKQLLKNEEKEHAKKEFLKYIKNDESDDSDTQVTSSASEAATPTKVTNDNEPPLKRMKYSSISNVLEMIGEVETQQKKEVKRRPKVAETQLNAYLASCKEVIKDSNVEVLKPEDYLGRNFDLQYWSASSYQVIAPFCIDILSASCSSAPVERTFSIAGVSTSGRRNRLASSRLENEVLLKKNRQYYDN